MYIFYKRVYYLLVTVINKRIEDVRVLCEVYAVLLLLNAAGMVYSP